VVITAKVAVDGKGNAEASCLISKKFIRTAVQVRKVVLGVVLSADIAR
jgi:hypothetical protein